MPRQKIWHRGSAYEVQRKLVLGQRTYLVLKSLSSVRERLLVFDPLAGPEGDLRSIHVYPRTKHALNQLTLLHRISENNTNVPTILEFHPRKNQIFVVMTWIHGQDVASYLDGIRNNKYRGPSPREVVRLVRGLAHGISNLNHRKNIVHGDIKPMNLILTREPSRLVMIDFGSSWFVEHTLLSQPPDGATPGYAAPEQLADKSEQLGVPDFRSDQFAVMVMCYELLTLELPYAGLGGMAGIDREHRRTFADQLVVPSKRSKHLDDLPMALWDRLDRMALRGLSLDPDARYPNRREWLKEFDYIYAELRRIDDQDSLLAKTFREAIELPRRLWRRLKIKA